MILTATGSVDYLLPAVPRTWPMRIQQGQQCLWCI